jgi:hypothetical protein
VDELAKLQWVIAKPPKTMTLRKERPISTKNQPVKL